MKLRKYDGALKQIEESRQWPENLGEGKPYDVNTKTQDYLAALCLHKSGKKSDAAMVPDDATLAMIDKLITENKFQEVLTVLQKK
jgi:hypothetical protein